jgi:glycerol uptake facilitator-like aquaporin
MQQVTLSSLRDSVSLRAFRLQQQKRLLVELFGSFFLSAAVLMSQSSSYKSNIAVAMTYGGLLYSISPQMSGMGASFNPGVAIACLISGSWDSLTFALAIIGQILGTVLGSLLGLYIHKHAYFALTPKKGMYRYDADIMIVDFSFGFLLSFVGSSGMTAGEGRSMSYPIAMTAVIVSAGLVASSDMPFTALNPIMDVAFTSYLPTSVIFVRIIMCLVGGLIAGLFSEAIKRCERRQDDMTLMALCGRGEVVARPSDKCGWLSGFLLEGAGTFYMTVTFCLAAHRRTSDYAIDAQALGVGSIVVALSYLSHGGCFNPAVAFAVYLQDRNCAFPTMSTWSLLIYSLLHVVAAFVGALMCLWICNGVIPIPQVKPIYSAVRVAAYSESLLSGLIVLAQLFTSTYAARVWTTPTATIVRSADQQALAVGFAVAAALLTVSISHEEPYMLLIQMWYNYGHP